MEDHEFFPAVNAVRIVKGNVDVTHVRRKLHFHLSSKGGNTVPRKRHKKEKFERSVILARESLANRPFGNCSFATSVSPLPCKPITLQTIFAANLFVRDRNHGFERMFRRIKDIIDRYTGIGLCTHNNKTCTSSIMHHSR